MENPLGHRLRELPGPVLLTGHTGFKGTWMTFLLEHLNIPVVGYSLTAEKDSLFDRADRTGAISEEFADIRDYETLEKFIDQHKPSVIIHMAAQPLVLKSYENPRETFDVNVMGTVNLLDIAFKKNFVKVIIVVTSDKVYRNDNSGRAFVETDPLAGKDPYSASKVGTEAAVAAWQQMAEVLGGPRVVSVRAGNVIGGGDYAENRIIPDLVRGALSGNVVEIRYPNSTRPWQHVLDPIIGYLMTIEAILGMKKITSINFGPIDSGVTVNDVVKIFSQNLLDFKIDTTEHETRELQLLESKKLEINPEYAKICLGWTPIYNSRDSIVATAAWWNSILLGTSSPELYCRAEIAKVMNIMGSK